jgi:hypothetical protein
MEVSNYSSLKIVIPILSRHQIYTVLAKIPLVDVDLTNLCTQDVHRHGEEAAGAQELRSACLIGESLCLTLH